MACRMDSVIVRVNIEVELFTSALYEWLEIIAPRASKLNVVRIEPGQTPASPEQYRERKGVVQIPHDRRLIENV